MAENSEVHITRVVYRNLLVQDKAKSDRAQVGG